MDHPFLADLFEIPWSQLTPDRIETDISAGLVNTQQRIDAIAAQDADGLTFENTLLAFEEANEDLSRAWNLVSHLDSVNNSPTLREAHNKMLPRITEFTSRVYLNPALWETVKAYSQTDEAKSLTGVHKRLLDETLADFKESGADLPDDKKKRLEALNSELAELTQKYSENVLDSTNAWELIIDDESKLAGLPDSAKEAARADALAKGHGTKEKPQWRFTQQYPSLLPVMTYLDDGDIRKQVWEGSTRIGREGDHDNTEIIRKTLAVRQEKAELIGKANFPDLVTARRMAKSGQRAVDFIEDLHVRVKDAFTADFQQIEAFKAEQTGSKDLLEPWETAYWSEKLRRSKYDLDAEELRPYFPLPKVKKGLFEITERLFGIKIVPRSTRYVDPEIGKEQIFTIKGNDETPIEVWHPEVVFFEIVDGDGTMLGAFYADWHPRESKRSGAWMNHFRTGGPKTDGTFDPHLGLMCGNMTKPTADKPALMTHEEVETIFHEFGHLLHHLLGRVEIKSLNGVNVAWDFVELPSQIMENWCWEREALNLFAQHYQSGEVIPDELYDKMIAARNFQEGAGTMRQLGLAKLDLDLHQHPDTYTEGDLDALLRKTLEDYTYNFKTTPPSIVRRFGHLFSSPTGYAAGYYSYKWAEALDADAFTRFQKEGVLNEETGMAFRRCILEKGNSEAPEKLFKDFMGRDPDPEALLKRAGLV